MQGMLICLENMGKTAERVLIIRSIADICHSSSCTTVVSNYCLNMLLVGIYIGKMKSVVVIKQS